MSDECLVMLTRVNPESSAPQFQRSGTTLDLNCIKRSLFRPQSSLKSHIGVTA